MLGKADLCELSREDINSSKKINNSDVRSSLVFLALNEILWKQPEIREQALAVKRQEDKVLKSQIVASQTSSGTSFDSVAHES